MLVMSHHTGVVSITMMAWSVTTCSIQPRKANNMTPSFQQELINMGVIPPMMIQELETVADTRHLYPDVMDKSYFNDPRDANGEVPF